MHRISLQKKIQQAPCTGNGILQMSGPANISKANEKIKANFSGRRNVTLA